MVYARLEADAAVRARRRNQSRTRRSSSKEAERRHVLKVVECNDEIDIDYSRGFMIIRGGNMSKRSVRPSWGWVDVEDSVGYAADEEFEFCSWFRLFMRRHFPSLAVGNPKALLYQ